MVRAPMHLKLVDTLLYRKVAESIFQDSLSPSPSCSYYDMLIPFYRRQAWRLKIKYYRDTINLLEINL